MLQFLVQAIARLTVKLILSKFLDTSDFPWCIIRSA